VSTSRFERRPRSRASQLAALIVMLPPYLSWEQSGQLAPLGPYDLAMTTRCSLGDLHPFCPDSHGCRIPDKQGREHRAMARISLGARLGLPGIYEKDLSFLGNGTPPAALLGRLPA
jgi:hypothetical protein